MTTKKTIPVRMYRATYDDIRKQFPNVKMADFLDVTYKTSAIRIENFLRKKPK